MGIGIDNNYSSYYTQITNNHRSNTNKAGVSNINITDKTTVSNTSTTNKTIAENEYFKNLCDKYSNINLNMSDSYLSKDNEITFNVSPKLISKAISDPEVAETLNKILDKVPSVTQHINDNNYTLDGRKVNDVSFVIDENAGITCDCKLVENNSENTSNSTSEDHNSDINLSTIDRFPKDGKISVWVSVVYLAKATIYPEVAKKLDGLLDSLEEQMSSLSEYIDGLGNILTGTEAKGTKVEIDENGRVSFKTEFEQENSENTNKTNSKQESIENQIEERKEKAESLKETQEKDLKAITEQKLSYYYNM